MVSFTEQWKKHQPYAKIENDELIIQVGRDILYPMEENHLIQTIDILSVTKAWLVNVKTIELQPSSQPIVEIPLSELKPGTYKIQAKCNLHGTWEDEIVI